MTEVILNVFLLTGTLMASAMAVVVFLGAILVCKLIMKEIKNDDEDL